MKPVYEIYKKVKTAKPHCPQCGEELRDNSRYAPWECSCGVWMVRWREELSDSFEYDIVFKVM